ncbi:MAG: helix-turn-helix domain-containing protein [Hyphomonadaceae bacterium]|nr:helix-turn-helix domain-containing protein [Hyphomonadaceae bacterium]
MGVYDPKPWLLYWGKVPALFLPQVVYFYIRSVVSPAPLNLRDISPWHFAAMGLIFTLFLPILMIDADAKLALQNGTPHPVLDSSEFVTLNWIVELISFPGRIALALLYSALALRLISQAYQQNRSGGETLDITILNWLRNLALVIFAAVLVNVIDYTVSIDFTLPSPQEMAIFAAHPQELENTVLGFGALMLICYFGLKRGAVFARMAPAGTAMSAVVPARSDGSPSSRSAGLPEDQMARIAGKLETAMRRDRLYENPNLSRRQLSDAIGTTDHRVSEVLNRHLCTSFYDYVNSWRIHEAKRLLAEDSSRSVLEIALEVGFNSRSTFYSAFRKSTGQNPSEFRELAS